MVTKIVERFCLKSVICLIILAVSLCVVEGTSGIRRSFTFTDYIGQFYPYYEVLEGDTIDLICQQPINNECQIWGSNIDYVRNGYLSPSLPDNIIFNRTFSACILTIINISRDNQDEFYCLDPELQYLIVKVIYSPPEEYPRCTSNYELPIVFSDQLQVPLEFNCTTEEGNTAVNISFYVETEGRQNKFIAQI
ncbi:hypothetical protein BSL78_18291 [Apostichopus japonicus]|uniref:Uncharacterized protein n=1 Tax=Stichopus japonicus TaxID=307972 RepID=A0A2G8KA45_STIJA|nr:hypothetical protein BSL78_18291 [Apostichopus japonicus]